MINFKTFLFAENYVILEDAHMKTHLSHLEDLAIEQGKTGFNSFFTQVDQVLRKLQGFETNQQINAKIDGSPMILFGLDPRPQYKNQFFISTKSGLNPNTPKIAHSNAEIQKFYGQNAELASKLTSLLTNLRDAYDNSGKIYQGDVLYAEPSDKTIVKIGEEDFIVFKPNVVVYAVPFDPKSEVSKQVQSTDVGIIVHESFRGVSINEGKAIRLESLGRNISNLISNSKHSKAFIQSSNYGELAVNVPDKYFIDIEKLLVVIKNHISNIDDNFDKVYMTSGLLDLLKIYINKQVDMGREGFFGKISADEEIMYDDFIENFKNFITQRYILEKQKKKTEKGRVAVEEKLTNLLGFIERHKSSFISLLEATANMVKVKNILLQIFSTLESKVGRTFIQMPDGTFTTTKDEGYVLFVGTNHVKIVDRLDFTKTNRQFGGKQRTKIIS